MSSLQAALCGNEPTPLSLQDDSSNVLHALGTLFFGRDVRRLYFLAHNGLAALSTKAVSTSSLEVRCLEVRSDIRLVECLKIENGASHPTGTLIHDAQAAIVVRLSLSCFVTDLLLLDRLRGSNALVIIVVPSVQRSEADQQKIKALEDSPRRVLVYDEEGVEEYASLLAIYQAVTLA